MVRNTQPISSLEDQLFRPLSQFFTGNLSAPELLKVAQRQLPYVFERGTGRNRQVVVTPGPIVDEETFLRLTDTHLTIERDAADGKLIRPEDRLSMVNLIGRTIINKTRAKHTFGNLRKDGKVKDDGTLNLSKDGLDDYQFRTENKYSRFFQPSYFGQQGGA